MLKYFKKNTLMFKFLAKIIFYFLKILDDILFLIFKKNFRYYLYDFLRNNYSTLNFNSKKAKFFLPHLQFQNGE